MDRTKKHGGTQKEVMRFPGILLLASSTWAADVTNIHNAATATIPARFKEEMRESAYAPQQERDPFYRPVPKKELPTEPTKVSSPAPTISASAFRLQAILFGQRNPMVVINDQVLEWNKPTVLTLTGGRSVTVKVVEVAREQAVLEVEGQKLELHLEDAKSTTEPKKKP